MADHEHTEPDADESYGVALGFRIFEHRGEMYLAEAEIGPYVDEPDSLGATLVFHPLADMDPTADAPDLDWPAYPVDVDDDLTRDSGTSAREQFAAIVRQLGAMGEEELRTYLRQAMEEAEDE